MGGDGLGKRQNQCEEKEKKTEEVDGVSNKGDKADQFGHATVLKNQFGHCWASNRGRMKCQHSANIGLRESRGCRRRALHRGNIPMVEMYVELKLSSAKRMIRQVLPTPLSPMSNSLKRKSYFFAMVGTVLPK